MSIEKQEVVVTDIQIPFTSMIILMVKLAIASIPALFIKCSVNPLPSGGGCKRSQSAVSDWRTLFDALEFNTKER